MKDDRSAPLPSWIDSLSASDARFLAEKLIRLFLFRKVDAPAEEKYAGRTDMKGLSELLVRTDTDWRLREVVLNVGRSLYLSTGPRHHYYQEELVGLLSRAATELGRAKAGPAFKAAVERYVELSDAASGEALFGAGAVLDANLTVVRLASELVNAIVDARGVEYFSMSERRMVVGIVDQPTAQKLTGSRAK